MSEFVKFQTRNFLQHSTNINKTIANNFPNAILAEAIDVLGCRMCERTHRFHSDMEIGSEVE